MGRSGFGGKRGGEREDTASLGKKGGWSVEVPAILQWVWIDPRQENTTNHHCWASMHQLWDMRHTTFLGGLTNCMAFTPSCHSTCRGRVAFLWECGRHGYTVGVGAYIVGVLTEPLRLVYFCNCTMLGRNEFSGVSIISQMVVQPLAIDYTR